MAKRRIFDEIREGIAAMRERRDLYAPEQRRIIEAGIAEGLEDFKQGRFYGPFDTADEAISSIQANLKQRAVPRFRPRSTANPEISGRLASIAIGASTSRLRATPTKSTRSRRTRSSVDRRSSACICG
jgi:predicted transcriptional regulator